MHIVCMHMQVYARYQSTNLDTDVIIYRICLNISPGFYFLPGSGDPASKRDQPLFGTGIYKIICQFQQPEELENDCTNLSFLGCFGHSHSSETLKKQAYR